MLISAHVNLIAVELWVLDIVDIQMSSHVVGRQELTQRYN